MESSTDMLRSIAEFLEPKNITWLCSWFGLEVVKNGIRAFTMGLLNALGTDVDAIPPDA